MIYDAKICVVQETEYKRKSLLFATFSRHYLIIIL